LQQIGEGGMGAVFMAEQTHPVRRKVALKVIKPGMNSQQIIARFEAERQALALMDHVNIARVLDAGATAAGRPYFVMELVHGAPITQYCDDDRLTPRQRLELFVPVCLAIQHAHQKGIIHRDIKPSNVMITLYDGRPVPKVIDFGVAKATEQRLTERTLFTHYGTLVGTLEYMSPEQAEMSAMGVDTRSDIYALGVLLYELLTGSTPLSHKRVKDAAYAEILRMIKEEEPAKPSTRLSDSGEALASISAQRQMEPAKLSKLVKGELDWIVMKCLDKDRNRRYETASDLAADVQRYLNDEPVQACPPSPGYRLRKFARRNQGPVLAALLVLTALVAGIIGTTWSMLRATVAEAAAIHEAGEKTTALNEKEAALTTAKENEIRATVAQKEAQENLKDALAAVEQMLTRVAEERLLYVPQMEAIRRELLQDALKFYQKFREKKSDDPVIRREAALGYLRVARIQYFLGQYPEAETAYRNAIGSLEELDGPSPLEPARRVKRLCIDFEFAAALAALGKDEEAMRNIHQAVEIAVKLAADFPDDPAYRTQLVSAHNNLASALIARQPDEAEKILRRNLPLADGAFDLEGTHRTLGEVFLATRRFPEAEEAYRQALKYAEKLAAEFPSATQFQSGLIQDL
jgi:serine/threonine protein kinase